LFVPRVTELNKILLVIAETFPHCGLKNLLQIDIIYCYIVIYL